MPKTSQNFLDLYRAMRMAREIDLLEEEFTHRGEAFFHVSGAGHEGTVALAPHLMAQDWLHCHYRDKALMLARGMPPDMFFNSLFCKADSHSCGRQMSAHMSAPELNILSIVGPVGNSALQAVGVASVIRDQAVAPLVLCSLGDGMTQQGEVLEAIGQAVRDQLPVLFLIQNNRYAISTLTGGKTFFSRPDGDPAQFYGVPMTRINGRDVLAAYDAFGTIVTRMRADRQPAIVIFDVERLANHTNADDQQVYRSPEEIAQARAQADPVRILRTALEHANGVSGAQFDRIDADIKVAAQEAARQAQMGAEPQPVFTAKKPLPDRFFDPRQEYRGDAAEPLLPMLETIRRVLEQRMAQDERISLFGEDIEDPKGDVFGVTRGLMQKFPGRVTNSPLSESTIIGMSIGRALAGARPVAFLQFADFLPLAYNQIFAELGSLYWRTNGGWQAPVIVMISCGAYRPGLGPFHANSLESLAVHTPGIDVVMPSTAADAAGLLNAAFASERPTLFFYPKSCLNDREHSTSADVARQFVPLGTARHLRTGHDLTFVGWGNTVALCQQVAETLEQEGFSTETLDLRSLSPWDEAAVLASAEKTGRLIVVHEDNQSCGLGAEILATVMEQAQRPVQARRVTRPDTYIPCNFDNQLAVLPSYARILEAAADLLGLELTWLVPPTEQAADLVVVKAIGSSPSDESVTVTELHVSPGKTIAPGDLLATLEADKAIQELSSPVGGEIVEILVQESDMVKVGAPLMTVKSDAAAVHQSRMHHRSGTPVLKRKARVSEPASNPLQVAPNDVTAKPLATQETSYVSSQRPVGISSIATSLGSRIITNEHIV
ncbi:transketolase, partial [candidate division KSB3 bacterium]|nr:transketolase [candidate division KSB3 bacterium]MBD3324510.1 transketolase [candidate division KSB3 bacterium]